jgi:uncharacterized protein (TIGR03000 family)
MSRIGLATLTLALFAPVAAAQPRALPLSPGVMPGSPWGPGTQFIPAAPIPQQAINNPRSQVAFPVALPWGWGVGLGYRTYNPWTGYGYVFGGVLPAGGIGPQTVIVESPVPAPRPQPVITVAEEFPATLSVQLPTAGQIWLNDKPVTGGSGETPTLTSPILRQGEKYTFYVKARWTRNGKTYEAKRAVALGPGEHSRLMILSGDEVKE